VLRSYWHGVQQQQAAQKLQQHVELGQGMQGSEPEFVSFWKERLEFVFIIGVSLLLMIFFFPGRKIQMEPTFEMRFLFFVYGIIILINVDWKIVIGDSPFLKTVQTVV
jgi:hypothetical protein